MIRIQAADATNGKQYTTERGQAVTVSGIEKSDAGVTVELRLPSGVTQKVPGHYPLLSAGISVDDLFSGPLESIRTAIPDLTPEQLEELVFLDQRPEVVAMVTTEQARRAGSAAPVATAPVATPAPSLSLLTPPPEPVQGRPVFTPIPVEGTPRYSIGTVESQTGESANLNRLLGNRLDGAGIDEAKGTPPTDAARAFLLRLDSDATIVTHSDGNLTVTTSLVPEEPPVAPTRQEVEAHLLREGFTAEVVIPEKAEDRRKLLRTFTSPDQVDAAKNWPGYQAPTLDAEAKSWKKRYAEIKAAEEAGDVKALEALLELEALKIRPGLQEVARAAVARLSGAVTKSEPEELPDLGGCSIEFDDDPGLPLRVPAEVEATCRLDLPSDVVLVGGPGDPASWITVQSDRPWPDAAEPIVLGKLAAVGSALGWDAPPALLEELPSDEAAATMSPRLAMSSNLRQFKDENGLTCTVKAGSTPGSFLLCYGAGANAKDLEVGNNYRLHPVLDADSAGYPPDLEAWGAEHHRLALYEESLPPGPVASDAATRTAILAGDLAADALAADAAPSPDAPTPDSARYLVLGTPTGKTGACLEESPPAPTPTRPLYGLRFGADLVCPVCMARDVPPQLVAEGQVCMPLRLAAHAYDGSRDGDECEGSGQAPIMIHPMRVNQNREMVPVAGRTSAAWKEQLRKEYIELGFLADDPGVVAPQPAEPEKDMAAYWKEEAESLKTVVNALQKEAEYARIIFNREGIDSVGADGAPLDQIERLRRMVDQWGFAEKRVLELERARTEARAAGTSAPPKPNPSDADTIAAAFSSFGAATPAMIRAGLHFNLSVSSAPR